MEKYDVDANGNMADSILIDLKLVCDLLKHLWIIPV